LAQWRVTNLQIILTIDNSHGSGYVARIPFNEHDTFPPTMHSEKRNARIKDQLDFSAKEGETSWCSVKGACNGREMRRVMCVIDRDERRFKMLDLIDDLNDNAENTSIED
jgi:hypothetical protein